MIAIDECNKRFIYLFLAMRIGCEVQLVKHTMTRVVWGDWVRLFHIVINNRIFLIYASVSMDLVRDMCFFMD